MVVSDSFIRTSQNTTTELPALALFSSTPLVPFFLFDALRSDQRQQTRVPIRDLGPSLLILRVEIKSRRPVVPEERMLKHGRIGLLVARRLVVGNDIGRRLESVHVPLEQGREDDGKSREGRHQGGLRLEADG
jgi:hypothetical protein